MVLTSLLLTTVTDDVKDELEAIFLYGAVGDDSTAATPAGTALISETFRSAIDEFDKTATSAVTASLRIGTTENNGNDIKEFGWFDAASDGNMHLRNVKTTLSKTSDIQVFLDTTITILVTEG